MAPRQHTVEAIHRRRCAPRTVLLEDLAEDPLQAAVGTLLGREVGLEEPLVAAGLDLGQVGDRVLVLDPAEVAGGLGVIRRTVVVGVGISVRSSRE